VTERLRLEGVNRSFGGLVVASDVTFSLAASERVALIGPNGAGKTTLVNLISGALAPNSGRIFFEGRSVGRLSQAARVRAGMVRTFQISRLFREMTVTENVRIALQQRHSVGMSIFPKRAVEDEIERELSEMLAALSLESIRARRVDRLAIGEQRLVEIALALAMRPRLLLLDEPAAGVPEGESALILDAVHKLPGDLTVLLIEHDMDLVFRFARRIIVLSNGAVLADGAPADIARNERVRDVYFGRQGALHGAH
jgi:branched-chain amino acid transport system ATP-binding protein